MVAGLLVLNSSMTFSKAMKEVSYKSSLVDSFDDKIFIVEMT